MKIWGYIFIVLNIGAAGAFVYFATQVWKARTEWQLAVVKQQLVIDGLPLEKPPQPRKLNDGSVPFQLQVGETRLDQIKSDILKKLIPSGGKVLGTTELVTNQDAEVKRVEALVFQLFAPEKVKLRENDDKEYDLLTPQKRQRLAAVLISLAKGSTRMGVYALYRDLHVDGRYERARRELAYMGRTDTQHSTLTLANAIGAVNEALILSMPPEVIRVRVAVARMALAQWLQREITNAAPAPFRSPNDPPPTEEKPLAKNDDLPIIEAKLKPLIDLDEDNTDPLTFELPPSVEKVLNDYNDELRRASKKEIVIDKTKVLKNFPKGYLYKVGVDKAREDQIRQQIDAAVAELRLQADPELPTGVKGPAAIQMIPFLADLAGNPLDTKEAIAAARKRLLELVDERATSEAEKKSTAALFEILFAPKPYPQESDEVKVAREKAIDDAGLESLRAYFEEAMAKPSTSEDLPQDVAQARAKLAGLKVPRSVAQKRRDIAHLLYHLDGYLALVSEEKEEKSITRDISLRVRWFTLMFPAIAEKRPNDDTLTEEERTAATAALDDLYKQRTEWHQRVAAIVGLTAYVQSVEAQATELAQLTNRLKPRIAEEQTFYEKERQDLIFWVIELNRQLERLREKDRDEDELKKTWEADVANRIGEQKDLERDLTKVKGEAKIALTDLDKKVDELFRVTKKLGEAQDALLGLELQLRDIELNRKKN